MHERIRPLRTVRLPLIVVALLFVLVPHAHAQQDLASAEVRHVCALQMEQSGTEGILRIAVLGDSIAQGWGTSQPGVCSFPQQIVALAPPRVTEAVSVQMSVIAQGGKRADEMQPYASDLAQQDPDIVIVELGTNDERESWPIDQTSAALTQIMSTLVSASSPRFGHPYLLCLNVWPSPAFDTPAQLTPYDAAIQATCSAAGGTVIDLTPLAAISGATTIDIDGNWHPDDYGAQLIGSRIIQAMTSLGVFNQWCATPQACLPLPVIAPLPFIVQPARQPIRQG
jgi:lysophospholipase L1-like esterase